MSVISVKAVTAAQCWNTSDSMLYAEEDSGNNAMLTPNQVGIERTMLESSVSLFCEVSVCVCLSENIFQ